jgi:hypothetical protein
MMVTKRSEKRRNDPEAVRKRLENSLPWSLSRWFSNLTRGKNSRKKR